MAESIDRRSRASGLGGPVEVPSSGETLELDGSTVADP
jgi:hypothetical protein